MTAANYTRAVRRCQLEGSGLARVTSAIPFSTVCPAVTCTVCTTPARGARSSFSIFIASTTTRPAPASTCCPSATSTRTTRPGRCRYRLGLAGLLVLYRHFHPLAHHAHCPLPVALERLGGHGPRLPAQEQVIERRAGQRGEVRVDCLPAHQHAVAVHLHLDGLGADGDEVLHAASSTATVSTCAVCGNRSNARTAITR